MSALGTAFMLLLGCHIGYALAVNRKTAQENARQPALTALVMLIEPFVVVCCGGARRFRAGARSHAAVQTALFVIACYFGYKQGVFSRQLVSPVSICLGLVAGHLVFGLSLLITHRSVSDAAIHFLDVASVWRFLIDNPRFLTQFVIVAAAEEMIYRVGCQPLIIEWTGSAVLGIVAVAVCFSIVHEHFFKNDRTQSVEFFAFGMLLGALYYWTASLILVVVVHALRNIEIAFLEHLGRVEELGGEEQACREAELRAGNRVVVMLAPPARDIEIACFEYSCEPFLAAVPLRPDAALAQPCV